MSLDVKFVKDKSSSIKTAIITQAKGADASYGGLDRDVRDFVKHALSVSKKFKAGLGEVLDLVCPSGLPLERVLVLGLGEADKLTALKAEEAGGKLYAYVGASAAEKAALYIDENAVYPEVKNEELAASLASGAFLRSYKFDHYKSKKADDDAALSLKALEVVYEHQANAKAVYKTFEAIGVGVYQARDLVNIPPNDLYPEAYAKIIKDELKPLGVEIEILDEKKMLKLGMGAIMAVGQGSERQPRMVVMRWNGGKSSDKPLAFVGKGVTFDTGGISIKPAAGMDEMKMDMGGSAAVVGLMKTLASRKAKANVVGIVGLAENMPSHNAYRPGDIIKSYSGKTIEVLNTDAEGRLVLADCLTYVQEKYSPRMIIDLATLTGAIMVALGHEYCGSFVNDESLWKQMENASTRTGEKLWRMPLDEAWSKMMESDVADLQNISKGGRWGGSCTAAAFLQAFIEGDTPWAHMDIAGTAWRKSDQPTVPKFGSGFGVRVLNELVAHYYETQ